MDYRGIWRGVRSRPAAGAAARLPTGLPAGLAAARAGFTLVEMLVVLVIIGLIMGLVGPRVLNYLTDARAKSAKLQIESFSNALDLFYIDAGRYPATNEGLKALVQRPAGVDVWNGPYLKGGAVPNDPWGNGYVYRSPGEHGAYDIVSLGADGRAGGDSANLDITSWKR
jgi:general secretion pathway protein G